MNESMDFLDPTDEKEMHIGMLHGVLVRIKDMLKSGTSPVLILEVVNMTLDRSEKLDPSLKVE